MKHTIPAFRTGGEPITVHHSSWYVPSNRDDVPWMTGELKATRRHIWSFKEGRADAWAIERIKALLLSMTGFESGELAHGIKYLFIPIPASTIVRTYERLHSFSHRLCSEIDIFDNGFGVINRIRDIEAKHLTADRQNNGLFGLEFDSAQILDRPIFLFDDVITKGDTIINYVQELKNLGALQVVVMTLARTVPFDHEVDSNGNLVNHGAIVVQHTPIVQSEEFKGGVYIGEMLEDGTWHGKGKVIWIGGDTYEGHFVDGFRSGKGIYRWPDGGTYEGDFVEGKRTGKGVRYWPSAYISSVEDLLTRNGRYNGTDHSARYEGDFVDGELSGKGVYRSSTSGAVYEGDFVDGEPSGKGVLRWPDGIVYEGDIVEGKRTGKGVYRWPNGNVYEGDFVNGMFEGSGVLMNKNGNILRGGFKQDLPFGPTFLEWPNGAILEGFKGMKNLYEGPARFISGCREYEFHIFLESGVARKATLVKSPNLENGEALEFPLTNGENEPLPEIFSQLEQAGIDIDYIKEK